MDGISFDVPDLDTKAMTNLDSIAPGIGEIVVSQQQPGESWIDTLAKAIPMLAATVQQQQLLNIQVDRARQGLPPLNVSQYSGGTTSPDTKMLLYVGGAALAFYLLTKKSRGR